ncbi:MAG: nitrite reductase [Siculibacillus sp.]|nr:nitrite reductase [Siculibacillus sp.]
MNPNAWRDLAHRADRWLRTEPRRPTRRLSILDRTLAGALGLAGVLAVLILAGAAHAEPDAAALYGEHCAACHGETRLGGQGPALLPVSLGRIKAAEVAETIRNGRAATQMEAFSGKLGDAEIAEIAAFVLKEPKVRPNWTLDDVKASREVHAAPAALKPVWNADPLNLFVVVEAGDHHVTLLDGDTFEPITRFPSRFALHGGPKFTPDGRHVFFGSRDGWITKYDLWTLTVVAEARAGINMRNIALSSDGKWIAAANYLPSSLVILSADDLSPVKQFDVADEKGTPSRVSAVYQAPDRRSFVAALKDVPEVWEIPTTGSGATPEFPLRRIAVADAIDDFFFDKGYRHLLGASRDGAGALVVRLDDGVTVATLPLPGMPHLGSGITFVKDGRRVIAAPHLKEGKISIIDAETWRVTGTIATSGPGFFLRSHEKTPHIWADAMMGPKKDGMQIIDKRTLSITTVLAPEPGKIAAHTEFDRSGRHALVSVWDPNGALVVYDAETLKPVKRLPMRKPVGKYNVFNKITFSEGTSH